MLRKNKRRRKKIILQDRCRCAILNALNNGPVAQGLEQATHNRLVGGSIPSRPTCLKLNARTKSARFLFLYIPQCAASPIGNRKQPRQPPTIQIPTHLLIKNRKKIRRKNCGGFSEKFGKRFRGAFAPAPQKRSGGSGRKQSPTSGCNRNRPSPKRLCRRRRLCRFPCIRRTPNPSCPFFRRTKQARR